MEAVTADALVEVWAWQCKGLGDEVPVVVKNRVEASDLRHVGVSAGDGVDALQVCGLMQWR